jgi:hypothetical protein
VWANDFGDLPIPVVAPKQSFSHYDSVPAYAAPISFVPVWHGVGTAGEPAFVNSWHNYAAGWANAGFWKDPFGIVHLRGLIGGGTMGVNVFVLPVGFRPAAHELFPTYCYDGATNMVGRVTVLSDGGVEATYGGSSYFSLSNISFDCGVPLAPASNTTQLQKREDTTQTNPAYQTEIVTPNVGELVIILDPWGVKRFPVCIGTVQSRVGFWEGS